MFGLDGIDQDDRRYNEPDPDVMRDRWQELQWEAERHDDGPDYRCAPMRELGSSEDER